MPAFNPTDWQASELHTNAFLATGAGGNYLDSGEILYDGGTGSVIGSGRWMGTLRGVVRTARGVSDPIIETLPRIDSEQFGEFARVVDCLAFEMAQGAAPVLFNGEAALCITRHGIVMTELAIPQLAEVTGGEYTALPVAAVRFLSALWLLDPTEETPVEAGIGDDGFFRITVRLLDGFASASFPVMRETWFGEQVWGKAFDALGQSPDAFAAVTGETFIGAMRGCELRRYESRDSAKGKTQALKEIAQGAPRMWLALYGMAEGLHMASARGDAYGALRLDDDRKPVKLPGTAGCGVVGRAVLPARALFGAATAAGEAPVRIGFVPDAHQVTVELPHGARLAIPSGTVEAY